MTMEELFCTLNETFPEDGLSANLQGKNVGNAQIYRASLLSFMSTKIKYYLTISEIFWSDNAFWQR